MALQDHTQHQIIVFSEFELVKGKACPHLADYIDLDKLRLTAIVTSLRSEQKHTKGNILGGHLSLSLIDQTSTPIWPSKGKGNWGRTRLYA